MSNPVTNEKDYNLDEELIAKFEELFGKNSAEVTKPAVPVSALIKTIRKKREQATLDDFFSHNGEVSASSSTLQHCPIKSLIPIEKTQNTGKHFSIVDVPGNKTLVYEVYICVDSSNDTGYYSIEQVKSEEEVLADGNVNRTFYIEDAQEDGNRLIFFTLSSDAVLINNGILLINEVRISKKPTYFAFNSKQKHYSSY